MEGKNLILEYRSADGVPERFAPMARELIEAKCDVIFAIGAIDPRLPATVWGDGVKTQRLKAGVRQRTGLTMARTNGLGE